LTLNGSPHDFTPPTGEATVATLLRTLGFPDRGVLVERNGDPVRPEEYPSTVLETGDALEIVKATAGG
jgi:thiamine biosynthesis protein ThiS